MILSGGDLGGQTVDAAPIGTELEVNGLRYLVTSDDLAVFIGFMDGLLPA